MRSPSSLLPMKIFDPSEDNANPSISPVSPRESGLTSRRRAALKCAVPSAATVATVRRETPPRGPGRSSEGRRDWHSSGRRRR